ncbi:general secretion pathway protein GspB [Vibrio rumoiensis]|uniref:Type II secretion system protein GspB C-terminal domain-containing protein n=1 Tax=Vibrio rumoiensis 1S-45 TaxID=1188252 RepID=A0A1E5E232_9VIBR|nr:general secretion pathway protein GspB [Vibrio rumoiensis]OEF25473.1 hypothetical protein A1QC_08875 [Vibrio rumoiensis 1S-45]
MSEVMKALQQSEQAYQAQSAPKMPNAHGHYMQTKPFNKGLVVLLAALPVALVLGAVFFYHQANNASSEVGVAKDELPVEESVISQESPAAEPENLTQQDSVEVAPVQARLLPYPEIEATKTLPAPKVKAPSPSAPVNSSVNRTAQTSSRRADGGTIIKTDQINMDDQNSDWGVNELDLSGVSPELAEIFRTAIDSPAASRKKAATAAQTSMQLPQGTVNLVGNEKQYAGYLPKMNFETHMYSSQPTSRWIKVNGTEAHEGDWIVGDSVKLDKILPGSLVIQFDGQLIQVPALYEWNG